MKTSALLLFGFVLFATSVFSQTESEIRERIVGTWKLASAVDIMKDGSTRPYPTYGPHGKGFLMYQRDGYMCAGCHTFAYVANVWVLRAPSARRSV
jgi:hypothetical protein